MIQKGRDVQVYETFSIAHNRNNLPSLQKIGHFSHPLIIGRMESILLRRFRSGVQAGCKSLKTFKSMVIFRSSMRFEKKRKFRKFNKSCMLYILGMHFPHMNVRIFTSCSEYIATIVARNHIGYSFRMANHRHSPKH